MASVWYTGNTKIWPEFSCDDHLLTSWVVLVLMSPSMNEPKEWLKVLQKSRCGDSLGVNAMCGRGENERVGQTRPVTVSQH